jgi:thiol-disulfide isomerase/thioredoxin
MKTVFYFTAEWCGPCKKTRPVVEDMKKESFDFQMVDADYEQLLVKKFEVKSVPTFILIENGKELNRITGAKTREELENFINYEKTIQKNI